MLHRFLTLLFLCCYVTQVYAEGKGLRVAVVNMQKVLNESTVGKSVRKKLEGQVAERQAGLDKEAAEIKRLQEELAKQGSLLSVEALTEKKKQLQVKQRDLARKYQDEEDLLVRRRGAALNDLVATVNGIVDEIAVKSGYQFVLDLDGRLVLYSSERVDLTQQVITELNRR